MLVVVEDDASNNKKTRRVARNRGCGLLVATVEDNVVLKDKRRSKVAKKVVLKRTIHLITAAEEPPQVWKKNVMT